ncbi:hypothetical protein LDHU3_29.1500:CDS1 [Leishmania donovani]|uniref:Hypothetical_protein n=1 Tax=Leishmania donovani TaxID=5661 RepID=A0A504XQU8_LEIDO|nr:hypothetical protein CGC20_25585 [Leishmania donovani]CAJ1990579.1 hypothetical protein LDHU3_29.1500:CDS1 [Leishmania donovani]VDZ46434.1 hypothetical_protein [Leishmania donovani]
MAGVAYIVRCQRCGVARKSYNDPRRGISVIECKQPCGNSHYNWTYIQTIPESEEYPLANVEENIIPVYAPPTRALSASPSPPRHTTPPSPYKDKGVEERLEFCSEGRGSMACLPPAPAGAGAQNVSSPFPGTPYPTHMREEAEGYRLRATTSRPKH